MISLRQDADGFIRMNRHFPDKTLISITFTDGSEQVYSGRRLNGIYDEALAVYRAEPPGRQGVLAGAQEDGPSCEQDRVRSGSRWHGPLKAKAGTPSPR